MTDPLRDVLACPAVVGGLHEYHIRCRACGLPGTIRVSVDPQPMATMTEPRHNVCQCACYWCHRGTHCRREFCES